MDRPEIELEVTPITNHSHVEAIFRYTVDGRKLWDRWVIPQDYIDKPEEMQLYYDAVYESAKRYG